MSTAHSLAMLRLLSKLGRPDPDSSSGWGSPPPGWHRPWPPWIVVASTNGPIPPAEKFGGNVSDIATAIPSFVRSALSRAAAPSAASMPASAMSTPDPIPPRMAIDMISAASAVLAIGTELPNVQLRETICTAAQGFINRFIDDYCGTPSGKPRPPRNPWSTVATAVDMYNFAEGLSEGPLRAALLEAAENIFANGMQAVEAVD